MSLLRPTEFYLSRHFGKTGRSLGRALILTVVQGLRDKIMLSLTKGNPPLPRKDKWKGIAERKMTWAVSLFETCRRCTEASDAHHGLAMRFVTSLFQ